VELTESVHHTVTVLMDTSETLMKIVKFVTIHVLLVMNMLVVVLLVLLTESLYHTVTVQTNITMMVLKIVNLVHLNVNSVLLTLTVLNVKPITSYMNGNVQLPAQLHTGMVMLLIGLVKNVTIVVSLVVVQTITNVLLVNLQTSYMLTNVTQLVHPDGIQTLMVFPESVLNVTTCVLNVSIIQMDIVNAVNPIGS
jgi:hypothetical protein